MDLRKIASPVVVWTILIVASCLWIVVGDIGCTKRLGGETLQACTSKPEAYMLFPHPVLYHIELLDIGRILQLILMASLDALVIGAIFSVSALRRKSTVASVISLLLFVLVSAVFAYVVIAIYLTPAEAVDSTWVP